MSSFSDIESASITDKPQVIALWQVCGLTRPWNDPGADFDFAMSADDADILILRRGDQLVATAMVGHDGHRGWVYYLAVAPDHQRTGLASRMMAACEKWARGRGVPKLQLMVRDDNANAQDFYRALGYEQQQVTVWGRWLNSDQG